MHMNTQPTQIHTHIHIHTCTHMHTHTHTHCMQESPLCGDVELKEPSGEVFAQLCGEFVFAYGIFGFGESFQVRETCELI